MTLVASMGVSSLSLTAVRTLLAALKASTASFISGKIKDTDLSLGAGAIRSNSPVQSGRNNISDLKPNILTTGETTFLKCNKLFYCYSNT